MHVPLDSRFNLLHIREYKNLKENRGVFCDLTCSASLWLLLLWMANLAALPCGISQS